ncbi:MAG: hypothetical protein ACKOJF_06820, partial [Planctomycetaceae bacterium]
YERLRVTMERRRGQLGELPSPERIPTSREELASFSLQQFEIFRQSSVEIEQLVIPKALVGWRPLWISLVLWSGAASVIWGITKPDWFMMPPPDLQTWLGVCGGIGLVFTLLSWLAIWISASQVTAGPLATAEQALVDGRAAHSQWENCAAAELRQAEAQSAHEMQALLDRSARHKDRLKRDHAASSHSLQESLNSQIKSVEAEVAKGHERVARDLRQAMHDLESRFKFQHAQQTAELQIQTSELTLNSRAEQAARQRARNVVEERITATWRAATDEIASRIS